MACDASADATGPPRHRTGPGGPDTAGLDAAARRALALRAAVAAGLLDDEQPVAGLLDVTGVRDSARALREAFATPGVPVTHTFAVKAASLVPVLRLLDDEGIGCEVASPGELALARAAGVPAERTVLDSPAKTRAELREALALGIAVNADNEEELTRLDALMAERRFAPAPHLSPSAPASRPSASPVGLRVNPQVGAGAIDAMSTATATSKFGVALRDPGAAERVVAAFAARPWLTRLHAHVGSQGCPLKLMAEGVRVAYELAERINETVGRRQVDTLDIGGGLPVDFASDEVAPTYREYADLLRGEVPGLFDGRYGIVTEFGRSLLAKSGTILARVEYAKSAGGRRIAVTHAGAQVATRTVFAPDAWPLRVLALGPEGRPKQGDPVPQDVAGPCCFAGDVLARARELPPLDEGDLVALPDTGAYYFSTHFHYNALPRPAVHGYLVADDGSVRFVTVRERQTAAEIVAESGAAHAEGLAALR
ncbi:diaminopimelate decarboxylase [Streptomyces sp. ICBB 8177]|uniref:diaminopimelate decarboxylase n=1 Tax=Streptomyces sp. ICBB 8177 TaxID=563922 RepID=UPI000D6738B1|nr:diaminopimelate decarboxylase [Streptomyces sp. ICBB 8177]PWI46065.1 diaminopimelate decarboxylase [Streptomyces sp. ICBB 8177]